MKTSTKMLCTAVLCCGAAMLVNSARAQSSTADADKSFLATASQSDMNEIAVSKVAVQKASDPKVKAFAQKMVNDHQTLETKMKPFADKWGVTPPSGPDSEHQAVIDKLNGLSGKDFDKEYMTGMAKDHHTALDAFKAEKASTTDAKFKTAVSGGEKVVAQHTSMADSMVKKMNGGSTSSM